MKYIVSIIFFLYSISANAEIIANNPKGNIGESVTVNIKISKDLLDSVSNISCSFEISNPTIFYPDSITINELNLKSYNRKNDSIYSFSFNNINKNDFKSDTLIISLFGELLAGNDSLTKIDFYEFYINSKKFYTFSSIIHSESIGTPLPYIRISTLEQNYPNPVFSGSFSKWSFRIDLESEIEFQVFNLIGQKVEVINLGAKPSGNYTFEFFVNNNYPSGLYRMILITGLNNVGQTFMVIK
jgi:hypothetical protein